MSVIVRAGHLQRLLTAARRKVNALDRAAERIAAGVYGRRLRRRTSHPAERQ